MIGETYFDARERLNRCLDSLVELGTRAGVPGERLGVVGGLKARMREPFILVVAGDPGSGRATFLEGLFGERFVRVPGVGGDEMRGEGGEEEGGAGGPRVQYFRYGDEERDIPSGDMLVESYRANEFLRNFHVIHVPVTLRLLENPREVVDRYVPLADMTFFLFAADQPWHARTWDLLEKVHRKWHRQTVFVLQRADLRGQRELDAILEHMAVTGMKRVGQEFPVFAVSGKHALEGDRMESGYEELERHGTAALAAVPVRRRRLRAAVQDCRGIMEEVRGGVMAKLSGGAEVDALGARIRARAEERREHARMTSRGLVEGLETEAMEAGLKAGLEGEDDVDAVGRRVVAGVMEKVEDRFIHIASRLEAEAKLVWKELAGLVRDHFERKGMVGRSLDSPRWETEQEVLRLDAEGRVRRWLRGLEMRKGLVERRRRRRRIGWGVSVFGIVCGVLAGLSWTGIFLLPGPEMVVSAILTGVALILVVAGVAMGRFGRGSVLIFTRQRLEGGREDFEGEMGDAFDEGVDRYFGHFGKLEEQMRALGRVQDELYGPQVVALEEIEGSFLELEGLIGGGREG
ncbi:MAG: hypothetical protein AAGD22_11130 [Verrucomicrobiota bacterium]